MNIVIGTIHIICGIMLIVYIMVGGYFAAKNIDKYIKVISGHIHYLTNPRQYLPKSYMYLFLPITYLTTVIFSSIMLH